MTHLDIPIVNYFLQFPLDAEWLDILLKCEFEQKLSVGKNVTL